MRDVVDSTSSSTARAISSEKIEAQGILTRWNYMPEQDDLPATKGDLNALRTELRGEIKQLGTDLRGEMREMHADLVEKMRDMQTEVLRAFHGWAAAVEIRLRVLPTLDERLGHLEERVAAIERRELGPRQ